MNQAQSERRTDGRVRKILGPRIELKLAGENRLEPFRGRLADVSRGGFGITCPERIEAGTMVAFFDPIASTQREGSVHWCRENPTGDFRVGISFRLETGGPEPSPAATRWTSAASGSRCSSEREKRQAVLSYLYSRRVEDPNSSGVQIPEIEEALAIRRDDLEFCFWYLYDSGFVTRSQNARFLITVKGVDEFEKSTLPESGSIPS